MRSDGEKRERSQSGESGSGREQTEGRRQGNAADRLYQNLRKLIEAVETPMGQREGEGHPDELEGSSFCWVKNTLLLEARGGKWDSRVVQLVHPVFGDIGH